MRRLALIFTFFIFSLPLLANGVGVIDAGNAVYLKLISSKVDVYVENQVAITKATMIFENNYSTAQNFKYAFPLPEGATATQLKWYIEGTWWVAQIAEVPQDTTLPGGSIHPDLQEYLGPTPLFFDITQPLQPDSTTIIELQYVELLPYEFGNVSYEYPNDYQLIQIQQLDLQEFNFDLVSGRTIENIQMLSHNTTQFSNNGYDAHIQVLMMEASAVQDYRLQYTLSLDELGLFSFSTMIPDTLVPDEYDPGYFVFVAEPDPGTTTDIIDKVFTLIVDRSGSMSGDKIVQARNAAEFIVENLNEGDMFNIVDFASDVTNFRNEHVPFTPTNKTDALNYIGGLYASGGTNISGAFDVAVPQFATASDSTANIIIFFTDGQPTAGITSLQPLLDHVQNLIDQTETNILLFNFGIGTGANQQLLTQLAAQNNGFAEFLGNDELESRITQFYLKIRNPVLLNTSLDYPENTLSEVYPSPLPNLYKGQQMIVSGRYGTPGNVNITLSGTAFGQNVDYEYTLNLADSNVTQYQFLPKVWAKQKIEYLLVLYHSLEPTSTQAQDLKNQIIAMSIAYGVVTEFTSFTGGVTSVEDETEIEDDKNLPEDFRLLGNYPNPFNPTTKIQFSVGKDVFDIAVIRIYNSIGELVRTLIVNVNGRGIYEVTWDGTNENGAMAPSDIYIYTVQFGNHILANKMVLMK